MAGWDCKVVCIGSRVCQHSQDSAQVGAQCLSVRAAIEAVSTGVEDVRNDAFLGLKTAHLVCNSFHNSGWLMPHDEGKFGLICPASADVQVGGTYATRHRLYEHLTWSRLRLLNFLNCQGLTNLMENSCFHECFLLYPGFLICLQAHLPGQRSCIHRIPTPRRPYQLLFLC